MPKFIKLRLSNQKSESDEKVEGVFEDNELERLSAFCKEASNLFESKIVELGFPGNINLSLKPREEWTEENTSCDAGTLIHVDGGITISLPSRLVDTKISLPETELWEQFLLRYRPIGLNDEQTYFFAICKMINRRLRGLYFNKFMTHQKEVFTGAHMQKNKLMMYAKDHVINSEDFFYDMDECILLSS